MKARVHACLECGEDAAPAGEFCSDRCRTVFNNRIKRRGAVLASLFMAHRFDRDMATSLGVLQAMNRLASDWRAEDRAERGGRRSWRKPADILGERPYLKSVAVRDFTGRGRRR